MVMMTMIVMLIMVTLMIVKISTTTTGKYLISLVALELDLVGQLEDLLALVVEHVVVARTLHAICPLEEFEYPVFVPLGQDLLSPGVDVEDLGDHEVVARVHLAHHPRKVLLEVLLEGDVGNVDGEQVLVPGFEGLQFVFCILGLFLEFNISNDVIFFN